MRSKNFPLLTPPPIPTTRQVVVCKNETDRTQKQIDCDANDYCISPEYFEDPFTEEQLRGGALAFHFLVMIWMFAGLAIVCDDYFESSLER